MDSKVGSRSTAPPRSGTSVPISELPPPDTKRWGARHKAIVVVAVRLGVLSIEEACQRYRLSVEKFLAWQRAFDRHGVPGLRTTRLQVYRDSDTRRAAPAP